MAKSEKRTTPRKRSKTTTDAKSIGPLESHPDHAAIAARAYELFQRRGAHEGDDTSDWLAAERELMQPSDNGN